MADQAKSAGRDPQAEIARLNKIIRVLMDRAERSTDAHGSDFTLFQTTVMLEDQVRARTAELQAALVENERIGRALRKSEARFAAVFELAPDPLALTRLADGVVLMVSRSYAEYFGLDAEAIIGRATLPGDLSIWIDMDDRRKWKEAIEKNGEVIGYVTRLQNQKGEILNVLVSGALVDVEGERCTIVSIHDISEQVRHAEEMEKVATHDPLTGLPNRLLLGDRLRQAIARNRRSDKSIAVCYLDLDGFKEVNDRFGHDAGDRLLVEVARRLLACVRSGDTVARLGGDEFVVLLVDLEDEAESNTALDRLLADIASPYRVAGGEHSGISASIGVTLFPADSADPDTLVRHADHAMYVAKQAGKNRHQMFDTRLEQRVEARQATLRSLADGLQQRQFCLYYQPKVDCRQGRVAGAEALMRWRHPTLGLMSPAEFVPLLEDTDLAVEFGEWTIRSALGQIVTARRAGIELDISVNAFVRHLLQPGFVDRLAIMLKEYPDAGGGSLQIEIVETAALKEVKAIRAVVEECRALGVTFALDDFGTGYSTLAHLRHLPAVEIKIDQSFVVQMLERPEDRAIVEAVIGLSRAFDLSVVAEGAETTAHIVDLLALGCDVMQGYALARPMADDDLLPWLRAFRPDPRWKTLPGRQR